MSKTNKIYKGLPKTNKNNTTKKSNSSHKNSISFKGYKIAEENMKSINKKQYYDLKRCSQQNCKKVFDDTIREGDKLQKKHLKEVIIDVKKNVKLVLKKHNLPKNHRLKSTDPAFKDFIKLNLKSRKKRLNEVKKLTKKLDACQKKHCKQHKNKFNTTLKKHQKEVFGKLNKIIKSFKKKV